MAGKLTVGMVGKNVESLHQALAARGFSIPDAEAKSRFFGPATRKAVADIQKSHGLDPTGNVCEKTATVLESQPGEQVVGPITSKASLAPKIVTPTRITSSSNTPIHGSDATKIPKTTPRDIPNKKSTGSPLGFTVRGQVCYLDGKPAIGLLVCAFDKDLRTVQKLGESTTDQEGRYTIPYTLNAFTKAEKDTADLYTAIYDADAIELGRSAILFNAPTEVMIDHVISTAGKPVSEYERILNAIQPLLVGQGEQGQNLPINELTHKDIDFLSQDTGQPVQQLGFLVQAAKSADTSPTQASSHTHMGSFCDSHLPAEVFYGWFRLGLPTEIVALWATSTDKLFMTLNSAIVQGIIPLSITAELNGLRIRIEQIKTHHALQTPVFGTSATLRDLLSTVPTPLSLEQQRALAASVTELSPNDSQLVKRIAGIPGFDGKGVAAVVARTFRLGALTGGYLPLTEALQHWSQHAEDLEGTLRPLATLRSDQWLDLAYTHGTPEGMLTPVAYADSLAANIERQHPNETLAAHLMEGRRLAQHPVLTGIDSFLRDNPTFDIVTANLNAITEQAKWDSVAKSERINEGLRSLQRFHSLGASWDETATLLENDLYGPHQLLAAGPAQLAELLDGQLLPERIVTLYNQAEKLHNITFAAFTAAFSPLSGPDILPGDHVYELDGDSFNKNDLDGVRTPAADREYLARTKEKSGSVELKDLAYVLKSRDGRRDINRYKVPREIDTNDNNSHGKTQLNLKGVPDYQPTLQSLFGSQDACTCGHCGSVLGQAAYFVDVMQFIKNASTNAKLLRKLLRRRPDLQDLELSCNNTNTETPAIDMALEILENAVALPLDVLLPAGTDIQEQLAGRTVGATVRAALQKTVRSLAGEVKATLDADEWTVVDEHRRWKLTAQSQEALKAETSSGAMSLLNIKDIPATIAALNKGETLKGLDTELARLFGGNKKLPPDLSNYDYTIEPLVSGKSWQVSCQFVAQVFLDRSANQLAMRTPSGTVWTTQKYNKETVVAVSEELSDGRVPKLVQNLLAIRFYNTSKLSITQVNRNTWNITSIKSEYTLSFTPARLTISSLAYQSGDANADAIAWPENHNPEAYEQLKKAVFPWSLPVDLPLEEVRLFLERARSSRQGLMEAMASVDQALRDDTNFMVEVLKLSAAEAKLIAPEAPPSDEDIFASWGLQSSTTSIFDAAIGKPVNGAPLDLLKNVSILLQQSRLDFEELNAVISTQFISHGGAYPLSIEPPMSCKPSEMRMSSLTVGHLDRIHRFVRLQRRLGWTIHDLDKSIKITTGITLDAKTLFGLADLKRLSESLHLPVASLIVWWSDSISVNDKMRLLASALTLTGTELKHSLDLLAVSDPLVSPGTALKFCERVIELQHSNILFEDLRYLLQHEKTPGDIGLDGSQLTEYARVTRDAIRSIPDPPEKYPPSTTTDPESIAHAVSLRLARENAGIAALATSFGAHQDLVCDLLQGRLRHPSDTTKPAIDVFFEAAFLTGDLSKPLSTTVESVLMRLYKTVFLCNALKVTPTHLRLLQVGTTDKNGLLGLDFNALPLASVPAPANVDGFEQFLALTPAGLLTRGVFESRRVSDLLRQYAALNFTDPAIAENARQTLATGLMVDNNQVQEAAVQLHITDADQYRDPKILGRLVALLGILKQLGAMVEQVQRPMVLQPNEPNGLISPAPNDQDANVARELLRSKYGVSQWHDLIKPIADELRERQRNALVDYLLTRDKLRNVDDLYERYLIDIQTGSCMKTTRLLQATSAVQLFVQRVLLNLESGASLSADKRDLWEWMHSYRVWEANRKVFLFPENWLLPELRDDKTAIFRQMESSLSEGEPTQEIMRSGLLEYLDGLGDLAQISVIAMYDNRRVVEQGEGERMLYIVGRTPNQPHRYFWRSCTHFGDTRMFWSGWEVLEIDNANDFIMPFVFENDLHLAWPIFREIADTKDKNNPSPMWEVQIAWTRKTSKGWLKRRIGNAKLTPERLLNKTEFNSFAFRLECTGQPSTFVKDLNIETVSIDCYAAEPEVPDPTPIDPKDYPTQLTHHGHNTHFDVNVTLTVNPTCLGHYIVDGVDKYEYLKDVTLKITYQFGYFGGGFDLIENKEIISTGPSVIIARNQTQVKATFSRPNSQDQSPTPVKLFDSDSNLEYQFWNWDLTVVFELSESTIGSYSPSRPVVYKKIGWFVMDALHDIQANSIKPGEELPIDFERGKVSGNGFTFDGNTPDLPLPLGSRTKLDRPATALTLRAAAPTAGDVSSWYVSDTLSRYYVEVHDNKIQSWPDGHEFVGWYRRCANASISTLFDPKTQALGRDSSAATTSLQTSLPTISFERSSPYANYNWELFLHVPLAIAESLASQQRFADARRWLHAVFNPTVEKVPNNVSKYWRFLPFHNDSQPESIETLLTWLADPNTGDPDVEKKLQVQIAEWKQNPFMPHLIARLRPSAYQWYTFFAYLNVLIGWGDQLFRRDTRESVNEATLLYVLAAKLLGPRPRRISMPSSLPPQTYRSISSKKLDDFSNTWIRYADLPGVKKVLSSVQKYQDKKVSKMATANMKADDRKDNNDTGIRLLTSLSLAFCIPENDKITEFYDLIEKRLFDVRHCHNIDGVFRELPLYDPPIDPLLLIRARAAGLSIDSVLADLYAPLPNYRFTFTLQKTLELCGELKALGGALLSAIEKQDAEELTLMRSNHELVMLKRARDVRLKQLDEANANIMAIEQSRATVIERFSQYQKLLGKSGITMGQDGLPVVEQSSTLTVSNDATGEVAGLGLIGKEIDQLAWTAAANTYAQAANTAHLLAGVVSAVPQFSTKTIFTSMGYGGLHLGSAFSAIAKAIEMGSVNANYFANRMGTFASYERRQDEWVHQSRLALAELKQLDKQILAAQIRKDIAQRELDNHDKQMENASEIDEFMRSKFTTQQLFRWMSLQIAEVYFRTYQLALDMGRRTERAYLNELFGLNTTTSPFVHSDNWDNLKRGLLAGEHLYNDLKRMESAYLERNVREFEITKHISLLHVDPLALIQLKETYTCDFQLPEVLFDLDYPGHYMRRIKMVTLSIPCVVGPYASVSATLKLKESEIRVKPSIGEYKRLQAENDPRFTKAATTISAIVTSSAQQDSGMFEPSLRDERYLPFEGAGVISSWKLTLPDKFRPFDYDSISDVVLHLRYTARDGGDDLKTACKTGLDAALNELKVGSDKAGLARLFSLKHEFPTEWYRFLHPQTDHVGDQTMKIHLGNERFSFLFRDATINILAIELFVKIQEDFVESYTKSSLKLSLEAGVAASTAPLDLKDWNGLLRGGKDLTGSTGEWTLTGWWLEGLKHERLDANAIHDIFLVSRYSVTSD